MSNDELAGRSPVERSAAEEEQEIRGLLETAGRRPAVPAEDFVGIKAAARIEWQDLLAARRPQATALRRLAPLALAASLLLAAGVGWWWMRVRPVAPSGPIATVVAVKGGIRAQETPGRGGERWRELAVGDTLVAGTSLTTADVDAPGLVALLWAGGASIRLDSGTTLRLVSSERLGLDEGAVYVDSGAQDSGRSLEISTTLGIVREVGTQFEVRVPREDGGPLRVRVRAGAVSVIGGRGAHPVAEGEELRIDRDGAVSRGRVEQHGPAWDWTLAAAPGIDIENLSLRAFLEWACRETGWRLRYADEAVATSAETIRLHGTIEGLRPDQAVGVVLSGSGLGHRVEAGTLLVTRSAPLAEQP